MGVLPTTNSSEFGAISLWDWWQRWGRKPTKMRNTTPRPHTVAGQGVRTTVNHSFSTKPNHNSTCIYLGVQLLGPILQCIRIFATSECFLSNPSPLHSFFYKNKVYKNAYT